jgi:hypothetical protein
MIRAMASGSSRRPSSGWPHSKAAVPLWSVPNKTSNPKRALSNLLERDRLFTERLQGMVGTTGLPAVKVDGRLTEDALESGIAGKFGLDG